jgi:hypothetical protein
MRQPVNRFISRQPCRSGLELKVPDQERDHQPQFQVGQLSPVTAPKTQTKRQSRPSLRIKRQLIRVCILLQPSLGEERARIVARPFPKIAFLGGESARLAAKVLINLTASFGNTWAIGGKQKSCTFRQVMS